MHCIIALPWLNQDQARRLGLAMSQTTFSTVGKRGLHAPPGNQLLTNVSIMEILHRKRLAMLTNSKSVPRITFMQIYANQHRHYRKILFSPYLYEYLVELNKYSVQTYVVKVNSYDEINFKVITCSSDVILCKLAAPLSKNIISFISQQILG